MFECVGEKSGVFLGQSEDVLFTNNEGHAVRVRTGAVNGWCGGFEDFV